MKYSIVFAAGLALVALAHAGPIGREDVGASDMYAFNDILSGIREKIGDLKVKIGEVKNQAKSAAGAKKEELQNKLQELQTELKGAVGDLTAALREIFGRKGATYAIEEEDDVYIMDTIKNLREKLQEKLELAKTLAEAAKAGGAMAKEEAKSAIAALKEEISSLRQDIRNQIRDMFNKKDTAETYGISDNPVFRDIIDTIKQKIGAIKANIADVKDQMKNAAGEKKQKLTEVLQQLQTELAGSLQDLKDALRHIFSRPNTYAIEENDDLYITETIKDLRAKLQEKLEILKTLAEAAKAGGAMAQEEAVGAIAALKEEIGQLRREIVQQIKDIFGRK